MNNGRTPTSRTAGLVALALTTVLAAHSASAAINATANGEWISVGIPTRVHLGTSSGAMYLNASDHGQCAGLSPTYFRFDTSHPHWKEMQALLLYAAAQDTPLDCVVDSGCGTSEIWVSYCRVSL